MYVSRATADRYGSRCTASAPVGRRRRGGASPADLRVTRCAGRTRPRGGAQPGGTDGTTRRCEGALLPAGMWHDQHVAPVVVYPVWHWVQAAWAKEGSWQSLQGRKPASNVLEWWHWAQPVAVPWMKFVWAAASGGCAAQMPRITRSATSPTALRVRYLRSMALASEAPRGRRTTILVAADADCGVVPSRLRVGSGQAAHSTRPSFGMRYVQTVARAAKVDSTALMAQIAVIGPLFFHQSTVSSLVEGRVMGGRLQAEIGRMAETAGTRGARGRGGTVAREAGGHGRPARPRLGVDRQYMTGLARGTARQVALVAEGVGQRGTGHRWRIEKRMTVRAGRKSARGGEPVAAPR